MSTFIKTSWVSTQDPEYKRLSAQLPAYQSSLETRYPPICPDCLPAVEEEIKRRDNMARTSALGGFLKASKGKGKERQVLVTQGQKEALERQLLMWKLRGALWIVSVTVVMTAYGAGKLGIPSTDVQLMNALPQQSPLGTHYRQYHHL